MEDETRRVREQLLRGELEAAEARAARELADTRAALVDELERKNQDLGAAYQVLQQTQAQLVQSAKMASLGQLVAAGIPILKLQEAAALQIPRVTDEIG